MARHTYDFTLLRYIPLFVKKDFDGIASHSMIIMTEKDAIKCVSLKLPNGWYMPVRTVLPADWELQFANEVTALVSAQTQKLLD